MNIASMTDDQLIGLIEDLRKLPHENECTEFKRDKADPQEVGELVSALSNSAALHRHEAAYVVWGVDDSTHAVTGTTFEPGKATKGSQELECWLATQLEPRINITFRIVYYGDRKAVILEIPPAATQPVAFRGVRYIRVGSYKKKLKEFPEKERELWRLFDQSPFEEGVAAVDLSADEVMDLLDWSAYLGLLGLPRTTNRAEILNRFEREGLITAGQTNGYDISNLGALLLARDIGQFARLVRKAVRVIVYPGSDRTKATREQVGRKGYASGFSGLVGFINDQLPHSEAIRDALRHIVRVFPEKAIRELVANALIHQDLAIMGTGPMVEIFSDRIEISNPGTPLVDVDRFIDASPVSRNERLASLMRRMSICEERGSGIDKVIFEIEFYQLPPPDFRAPGTHTLAVLFAPRKFRDMDPPDRVRACYQHACLLYVSGKVMSNSTLRKRFGLSDENHAQASRVIADAIGAKLIRAQDPASRSRKFAKYIPFWA